MRKGETEEGIDMSFAHYASITASLPSSVYLFDTAHDIPIHRSVSVPPPFDTPPPLP